MDDNTAQSNKGTDQEKDVPIKNSSKAPPPVQPQDEKKDKDKGKLNQPQEQPTGSIDKKAAASTPTSGMQPKETNVSPPNIKSTIAREPKSSQSKTMPSKPLSTQGSVPKKSNENIMPPGGSFKNAQSSSKPTGVAQTETTPSSTPQIIGQPPSKTGGGQPPSPTEAMETKTSTPPPGRGGSKFKLFVIIGIVVLLAIWGVVAYLFFENRGLEEQVEGTGATQARTTPSPTPAEEFTPDQIQIRNGNIVRARPSGEETVLVDKNEFASTGITGFSRVSVSPDNQYLCFESLPPAPEPALYYSGLEGNDVVEVSPNRRNCVWHPGSDMIAYTNYPSESQDNDIFLYVIATEEESNLTANTAADETRRYSVSKINQDGVLICSFEVLDAQGETLSESGCEIEIQSGSFAEVAS